MFKKFKRHNQKSNKPKETIGMKLTEIYEKSLKSILEECDIVDQKIHTDKEGEIQSIELKYRPKPRVNPDLPPASRVPQQKR